MVTSIRERVRARSCCCHLFTGMMVNLAICCAIGLIASSSAKRGWFYAIDTYGGEETATSAGAVVDQVEINYGWKRYCYKLKFEDMPSVEECRSMDQSLTTTVHGETATLALGGPTLQQWGIAAASVTFWTTVWSAGWFVAFLLLQLNVKPLLLNIAYMRIFGIGCLVAGIALAVTLGGFYGKAFIKFDDAYDNYVFSRPQGLFPVEAWFLLVWACLSFLGWGCGFMGSFGSAVDHAIWERGDQPVVIQQPVYIVNPGTTRIV